jgi:hypothetical protein
MQLKRRYRYRYVIPVLYMQEESSDTFHKLVIALLQSGGDVCRGCDISSALRRFGGDVLCERIRAQVRRVRA